MLITPLPAGSCIAVHSCYWGSRIVKHRTHSFACCCTLLCRKFRMHCGSGHYKNLMAQFNTVVEVFLSLDEQYQEVIADITKRMGAGMADFITREVCRTRYAAGIAVYVMHSSVLKGAEAEAVQQRSSGAGGGGRGSSSQQQSSFAHDLCWSGAAFRWEGRVVLACNSGACSSAGPATQQSLSAGQSRVSQTHDVFWLTLS